jgi:hypothetical protein
MDIFFVAGNGYFCYNKKALKPMKKYPFLGK